MTDELLRPLSVNDLVRTPLQLDMVQLHYGFPFKVLRTEIGESKFVIYRVY